MEKPLDVLNENNIWVDISSGVDLDTDGLPVASSACKALEIEGGGLLVKTLSLVYAPNGAPLHMSEALVFLEKGKIEEKEIGDKRYRIICVSRKGKN